jgi:hypothetical protein
MIRIRQSILICFFSIVLNSICLKVVSQTDIEQRVFNSNDSSIEIAKLTATEMADFKDKALRKTKALSNYISTIADKSKDETQRNKAIDLAVKLFMSENNLVEVSSLKRKESKPYKIRAYLDKLKMLPYTKITIEWFDIFYASNFVQRPDGRYEAIATIYQRFTGVLNEGGNYMDITKKNIQIVIEPKEILTGDIKEHVWEIFLGDIKVEETKPVNDKQ